MRTVTIEDVIRDETGYTGELRRETRIDSIVTDSLEFLSLVVAVENAFKFKVPDKKYAEVQTVGDLLNFANFYSHVSS